MSTFCIGDLHGCYDEFMQLLDKISFDEHKDTLYLTGDLIGRGPRPLETINFVMKYRDCIHTVLGNHDLNFLAVLANERQARPKDNLEPLLNAANLNEIENFLLSRPLIKFCKEKNFAVCHAGIHPLWDLRTAKKLSKEISAVLANPLQRCLLLRNMYRDNPFILNDNYRGMVRWRYIVNVFTRMRLVSENLALDYGHSSSSLEEARAEKLYPWFDFIPPLQRHKKNYKLIFGHWAALNAKCQHENIVALDTGCVWGGKLTAWNALDNKRISVPSAGHLQPSAKF